jgi:hypothetical protein
MKEDSQFFETNPHRSHRVRRAIPHESMLMLSEPLAPGQAWFVAIRQVRPGTRLRLGFSARADLPTDVDEELARAGFEYYARKATGKKLMDIAKLLKVLP